MPDVPVSAFSGSRIQTVMLKRPDGSTRTVEAAFNIPFVDPPRLDGQPRTTGYVCVLKGIEKQEIPIGTEIWTVTTEVPAKGRHDVGE